MKGISSITIIGLLSAAAIPGVLSLAVHSGVLEERQRDIHCSRPGVKTTHITPANETEALEKRANYNGHCSVGAQTCQLSWRDGIYVCSGVCDCLESSPCYNDNNYCFYNTGNGGCYCT